MIWPTRLIRLSLRRLAVGSSAAYACDVWTNPARLGEVPLYRQVFHDTSIAMILREAESSSILINQVFGRLADVD